MIKKSRGFTLIELLVVVAIIGILASVVLAALGSARSKGADAKIKSQLSNMRNQAELYSGATAAAFTPTAACNLTSPANTIFQTGNSGLGDLFDGLTLANTRCGSVVGLPSAGSAWAVAAQMTTGAWCVDSTGVSRERTAGGVLYTTVLTTAITTTACL